MMNKINIAICDDERIILNIVEEKVEQFLRDLEDIEYKIDTYNSGLNLLNSEENYHLLLLDIEMPEIDGLSLANEMNNRKQKPLIIFLTGYDSYMPKGFHVRAFRFLTKPINDKGFYEAISSAVKDIMSFDMITIKGRESMYVMDINEITHIESLGNESCIYTKDSHYIGLEPLKHWRNILPIEMFIQTHKSYIVNLQHVDEITKNTVYLKTGQKAPLAMRRRKLLNVALHKFVRMKVGR